MSYDPAEPEFHSFNVQYMGTAIIPQSSSGLKTLQKPLKDLYCAYQRPTGPIRLGENLLTITDSGVIVSRLMIGEVGDYATGAEVNHDISSIQFWDAVQFVTVREKEKKYRFAFEPLNNDHSRNKDNLFSVLNFKHEKHLTTIREHPALFVLTLRRKGGLKVLDLHAFVCTSDRQAIHLVEHFNAMSEKYANETNRRSVTAKKNPFGKKSNVLPPSQHISMNTNGVTNPDENTGKRKKKWGLFRKSSMSRSVSVSDLDDLSYVESRQPRYDLTKGDFVYTRKSRDMLWNQGSSGELNLSGYLDRSDFESNINLNQSLSSVYQPEIKISPQRSLSVEPFYQNGEQKRISDKNQSSHKFGEIPPAVKVLPQVAPKPVPQKDQFISIPSLGVGKTYRVYENTSREADKHVDNIVCEKFRIFGETRHSFDNQKHEQDLQLQNEKEPEVVFDKSVSKPPKIALIPNVLSYVNPESSGKDLRREHGYSSMDALTSDSMSSLNSISNPHLTENPKIPILPNILAYVNPKSSRENFQIERFSKDRITSESLPSLNVISNPQSPPTAVNNLRIGGASSPSYRRKFPAPKPADKKNQLLPSPLLQNNKQPSVITNARNVTQIHSKPPAQRTDRDLSATRLAMNSRNERWDNTRENDVPKKKKVPTATLR